MIFVTLGTQDKPFVRLLVYLDQMIENGMITDPEIIVQAGSTKYDSKHMKIVDYIDMQQFNSYIERCDLIISHAGVGTIINGINHGKKILAVARRESYGEHENDHQVEITTKFESLGYLIGCLDAEDMEKRFPLLQHLQVRPYESQNEKFCALIEKLIED